MEKGLLGRIKDRIRALKVSAVYTFAAYIAKPEVPTCPRATPQYVDPLTLSPIIDEVFNPLENQTPVTEVFGKDPAQELHTNLIYGLEEHSEQPSADDTERGYHVRALRNAETGLIFLAPEGESQVTHFSDSLPSVPYGLEGPIEDILAHEMPHSSFNHLKESLEAHLGASHQNETPIYGSSTPRDFGSREFFADLNRNSSAEDVELPIRILRSGEVTVMDISETGSYGPSQGQRPIETSYNLPPSRLETIAGEAKLDSETEKPSYTPEESEDSE